MSALLAAVETRTETGGWRWADLPAPWLLVLVAGALFLGLRWLYRRERGRAGASVRALLAALRAAALVAVLLLLAGPYREEVRTSEDKSHLVLLIDTSASMLNEDGYGADDERRLLAAGWPEGSGERRPARLGEAPDPSRLGLVKRLLLVQDGRLLERLAERFVLHVFAFDEDWRSLGGTEPETESRREGGEVSERELLAALRGRIGALEARGARTRIGHVLKSVAAQFLGRADQQLAGVVLITDGQDTGDGAPPLEVVTGLPDARQLHVEAVGLGNPDSDKNLRVEPIRAKDVVLARDEVLFESALRHKGFRGAATETTLRVERIVDAEGRRLDPPQPVEVGDGERARVTLATEALPDEQTPVPVRLWAPFDEPGTYRVSIASRLRDEARAREDAVLDDNVQTHELLVRDESIRVLFVDREPRYDWRFLSTYLTREAPPRATAGGRAPRSRFLTHALLQSADPTVEQPYTRSPGMLPRKRFPLDRAELFAYDVLILGDVDLQALAPTPERRKELFALIRAFVEEGGGLALQAGTDLKNPLDLLGTPLADLLPIVAADTDGPATQSSFPWRDGRSFRLRLTEAGAQHPAFQLFGADRERERPSPERVARIWEGADPDTAVSQQWTWYWTYRCMAGLRPGAVALATAFRPGHPDERALLDAHGQPLVALATMSFGRGRVFWSSIDDISRIRHRNGDQYYGAFWEQIVRELAVYRLLGGDRRFKIFPQEDEVEVGQTAEILILAQDERYQPLDVPFLDGVHVELPDNAGRIDLEGDRRPESTAKEGGAPGEYRFRLPVTMPGTHLVWIEQKGEGANLGDRAERRFKGVTRAREDSLKLPNHRVLEAIAAETGGHMHRLAGLPDLSPTAQTVTRVLDRQRRTQWDKPWVLFVLVGLLGLEWALRKRLQMV